MKNLPQKVRSKKLHTRVDLTAMVSISFLLIIFFMVVGELSKSKVMDLDLPDKYCNDCNPGCIDENRLYTILLDKDDRIITYSGLLEYPVHLPKKTGFGKNRIRKELFENNNRVIEYSTAIGKPKNGAIVIIKPSKNSNFKNLVDILDEMKIAKIDTYSIVPEFTAEESKLLAAK
ncbi:biopolymer transport protein ExbD [Flavobacterium nitrogenifigens]|uniref:Biopolymer transport protein ExbD n=2 Tax=Flavobacterium TaxID=237 RepID=A0A7W7J0X0_9FLAO|nr:MULTISPECIES: biopolymer transporter ExbD [Flavobacterium]MBB4804070.1 biopolymer transport protein ExbD [Flavobacterium nitrogenifigens]MBB6388778.1 biopolymer transport protein ExbD [Flavobacterium notoginsengisoli]